MNDSLDILSEITRFASPPNQPANRFSNFIYYFQHQLEKQLVIRHQKLCRSVRVACGLHPDAKETEYPEVFPFDKAPNTAIRFVEKLSRENFTKSGRKLGPDELSGALAATLGFISWEASLFALEVYQNLCQGHWAYRNKKIKKPKYFDGDGFFWVAGREFFRYGGFIPADRLEIFSLPEAKLFFASRHNERIIFPTGRRFWGNSQKDAKNWCVASLIGGYGIKSWNLFMDAQKIPTDEPRIYKKLNKADDEQEKWLTHHKGELPFDGS